MDERLKTLKVYQMNDCDWFADYSKEEAIEHYLFHSELKDDDIDMNEVRELTGKELKENKMILRWLGLHVLRQNRLVDLLLSGMD